MPSLNNDLVIKQGFIVCNTLLYDNGRLVSIELAMWTQQEQLTSLVYCNKGWTIWAWGPFSKYVWRDLNIWCLYKIHIMADYTFK